MKSKIELIDRAYSKLRISGLTFDPTPSDINIALDELEGMIAEWDGKNVCLDYNFEDTPNSNSPSNISRKFENAVQTNLAVRLAPEFGKDVPFGLNAQAGQSYSAISSMVAKIKQTPYPNRQPIGEANALKFHQWRRYYTVDTTAPLDCNTEVMSVNDITDSSVNYIQYLGGDTIVSAELEVTDGLELISHSFSSTAVMFRVKALVGGSQLVKITVKTANGLEDNRKVWFSVAELLDNNSL